MRHAQAQTVSVQLTVEDDMLCLRVGDDGCGFAETARGPGSSFGLVGMRERVQMLGGQLSIDSQPGRGTTITARVPLDPTPLSSAASTGALSS